MDQEEIIFKQKARVSKLISVIILLLFLGLVYFGYFTYKGFCKSPVSYTIGEIDPRFNLSQEEIKAVLTDSASRWDKASGLNAFEYDPHSYLKINLIYDDRQADLDKLKSTVSDLNLKNRSLDDWNKSLKQMIADYDKDLATYNSSVNSWNLRGGAPADIFKQLEAERLVLESRRNNINKTAELLNIQVSKYNFSVDQIKNEADKNKNQLITQGMYYSKENKIDVYTFGNIEELRLVLMHELGHARGSAHAANDLSIMYSILGDQNLSDPVPTIEDVEMITNTCNARLINNFVSKSWL